LKRHTHVGLAFAFIVALALASCGGGNSSNGPGGSGNGPGDSDRNGGCETLPDGCVTPPAGQNLECVPAEVNWALDRPATQSSDWHPLFTADRAVNNHTPRTYSATRGGFQAWWEVDLEEVRFIEYVNIWNAESWTSDFYVLTSVDPFVSEILDDVLAQDGVTAQYVSGPAGSPSRVSIDAQGRYVRVQAKEIGVVRLVEAEVMASLICFAGKAASQSSTLSCTSADRAIDGNTSGVWADGSVACTESEYQPWWEVDLGRAGYIDHLALWSDAHRAGSLSELYVLTSTAPFVSGHLAEVLAQPGVIAVYIGDQPDCPDLVPVKAKARYVRLQSAKSADVSLSIAEVRNVYPPIHAFQRMPARQSSTLCGGIASRAVDGNVGGAWGEGSVTSTAKEYQPWLEVDLGEVKHVADVRVWNRTDVAKDRLSDFYVLASVDPIVSSSLADVLAQAGVSAEFVAGQAGRPTTVSMDTQARYVRLQLTGTESLHVAELEVNVGSKNPLLRVFDGIAGPAPLAKSALIEESYVPGRQWHIHDIFDEGGPKGVFHRQFYCHDDADGADQGVRIKIGKGSQLYSVDLPGVGEIIPPQGSASNNWAHDCIYATHKTPAGPDGTIINVHMAGMTVKNSNDPLLTEPMWCPLLGEEFNAAEQSYSMVNLGILNNPSPVRGDMIVHTKYRYIGSGALEVSYYFYNPGGYSIANISAPWAMFRDSAFAQHIWSYADGSYGHYPAVLFNDSYSAEDSGGWIAQTDDMSDPDSSSVSLVHGIDRHSGEAGYENMTGHMIWPGTQPGAPDRDGETMAVQASINLEPGEGMFWRFYLVFGGFGSVVDTSRLLVDHVDYGQPVFTEAATELLPLYAKTEAGQAILTREPNGSPVAYSYSLPVTNAVPLYLLRDTTTGIYALTTDPYAVCGKHPTEGFYQVYDGKTEWVALLGYVMPDGQAQVAEGTALLSDVLGTDYRFVAGELLDADQLRIRIRDKN
jgi:hypothetical protein